MKRMISTMILTASMFMISCCAKSQTIKLDPKSTVRIRGVVTSAILPKAKELMDMASSYKEVTLLINSPGGQVVPGLMFTDYMELVKSRGTKIRCVVPSLAASMAFVILAHCDTRYTLPSAILLWHPAKLGCFMCSLSADDLLYNGYALQAMEKPVTEFLIKQLGVSESFFAYHYKNETLWLGNVLASALPNFIKVVVDVQGIPDFNSLDSDVEGYLENLLESTAKDF